MRVLDATISGSRVTDRSVRLAHADVEPGAGLEPGQVVLLRAGDAWRTAVVVDAQAGPGAGHYDLTLGGRVPPELAIELAMLSPEDRDARLRGCDDVAPTSSEGGEPVLTDQTPRAWARWFRKGLQPASTA